MVIHSQNTTVQGSPFSGRLNTIFYLKIRKPKEHNQSTDNARFIEIIEQQKENNQNGEITRQGTPITD